MDKVLLKPKPIRPIPVPGTFTATPVASKKAPVGKVKVVVSMPWNEELFTTGAKLSIFVPPLAKTVTATLPATKVATVELQLTLPDTTVGVDAPFAVGPISIVSAPAPPAAPSAPPPAAVPPPPPPESKSAPPKATQPPPTKKARQTPPVQKKPPPPQPPPKPPPTSTTTTQSGRECRKRARFGDAGEMDGKASKYASAPAPPKPYVSVIDEMTVPTYCTVGATIKVAWWHNSAHQLFSARVEKIRPKFPRIVVRFTADAHGNTNRLCLPEPITAYVHGGLVEPHDSTM